jgi:PAS domain S-box-containing protein
MSKKVLVVDNHPLVLKFMTDLLSKHGHQVVTANDGLEALNVLQTFVPQVMFVDLVMPNIDGKKLCQIIRKIPVLQDVYIVVLSAIAADEAIPFREFGADSCIAKGPMNDMAQHVLSALGQVTADHVAPPSGYECLCPETVRPRQITKELLWVKQHFESILASMAEGILETTRAGQIVYANPTALAIIGAPEERLLGARFIDLLQGDERQRAQQMLEMANSTALCVREDPPVRMNGKDVLVKVLAINGEHSHRILMLNDITERKLMEARVQQAQRMEAIGTLAAGIAHSFNNILTAIFGNISLAKLHAQPMDKVIELLEAAEGASIRAKDLTQQLLPFSQGGAPIKKDVSLGELMTDLCVTTAKSFNMNCELQTPDNLWPVHADLRQLRHAFNNLLINAAEVNPPAGTIQMSCDNVIIEEHSKLPLQPGRYVMTCIQDQGGGIPEDHLPKIFDPYFTTKGPGRGLGLTTAYSICQSHNGCITVECGQHSGATFTFYLPAGNLETARTKDPRHEVAAEKGRVLLMDDEGIIRGVVGQMLDMLGYSVALATEGQEALDLYTSARTSGQPFDAVIMDLTVIGGMGGKEATEKLLALDSDAKIIVASGYSNDPVMAQFRDYGFRDVLEKPFDMKKLAAVLHEVIADGPN